jgi:hypothetical protein
MSVATLINDRPRLRIRVFIGAAWALILSCATVQCLANQEPLVELTWEAPANCPQQSEVQEQIQSLVSGLQPEQRQTSLRVRGAIELSGEQFELTLLIQQGHLTGKRVIASDDCRSLGKAAAVVIGLLLRKERKLDRQLSAGDMNDGGELSAGANEPSSDVTKIAGSNARGSSVPTHDETSGTQWRPFIVAPNLSMDFGTLPNPGLGIGLGVGLGVRSWRALVSGEFWPSQTKPLSQGLGKSSKATFYRKSAELLACHGWLWHPFELAPCVQLAFDRVAAQAAGDRIMPMSQVADLVSVGGGVGGFWHLGHRASLFLMAMGRVATRRPTFVVQGPFEADAVHTIPPAALVTSFGCMWIF